MGPGIARAESVVVFHADSERDVENSEWPKGLQSIFWSIVAPSSLLLDVCDIEE